MSMDFNVYIDDISKINRDTCEKYLNEFEMKVEIHPEIDFKTHIGFLPFKIRLLGNKYNNINNELVSGFEFFIEPFDYRKTLLEITGKGLKKIFSKQRYIFNSSADKKLEGCKYIILLCASDMDSLELRMVFSFVSYLCEVCNGVFYDCQTGNVVHDNFKSVMSEQIKKSENLLSPENMKIHVFEEWR